MSSEAKRKHREIASDLWSRSNDPAGAEFGPELMAKAIAEAEQSGAERERAAITAYGYQELGDAFDQLAIDINLGKHLKGEE